MDRHGHLKLTAILLCLSLAGISPAMAASPTSATRASRRHSSLRGVPTFTDSSKNDVATYDDPIVRKAALDALGRYNGSVVAIDPSSGRILTIVKDRKSVV